MKTITSPDAQPIPRRPWNAAKAARVLQMQANSGLSLAAFARYHELPAHSLYAWRQKLTSDVTPRKEPPQNVFLPVELSRPAAAKTPESPSIEVVLFGGTVVRISGPVEFAQMTALLRAVREATC